MSKKEDTVVGVVTEVLADKRYRVVLNDDGREIIAYLGGKMKLRKINVHIQDTVEVVLDPYNGHATNRIVWRKG